MFPYACFASVTKTDFHVLGVGNAVPPQNYQPLLLYDKTKAVITTLDIKNICSMTKEKRLLEMFLLCWQRYEIKQVNQSSGAGGLQGSTSVVSIWSFAHTKHI
jgi:hypothetical protein